MKRWPLRNFAEVANRLDLPAAIVGGPADDDLAPRLREMLRRDAELWTGLALPELAGRLAGSRLFLGNDSGVSHLAAALGIACGAVYVSTEPELWGVRGSQAVCLSGDQDPASVADTLGALA